MMDIRDIATDDSTEENKSDLIAIGQSETVSISDLIRMGSIESESKEWFE